MTEQPPSAESMRRATAFLDVWFGPKRWPPVHKLDVLLASFCEQRVSAETERCERIAHSWQRADAMKLAAGEMTAQEVRTARAVAAGIERAIRAPAERPASPPSRPPQTWADRPPSRFHSNDNEPPERPAPPPQKDSPRRIGVEQPTQDADRPVSDTKLWLWHNGDHYLAFANEYPTHGGGDPMVLGEPMGWAIFRTSSPPSTGPHAAVPPESFQCPACRWHEGEDPAEWFAEEVKLRSPPAGVVDYTERAERLTDELFSDPSWDEPFKRIVRDAVRDELAAVASEHQAEIEALKHDIERYQAIAAFEAEGHSEALTRIPSAKDIARDVQVDIIRYAEGRQAERAALLARLRGPDVREAVVRAIVYEMSSIQLGSTPPWDNPEFRKDALSVADAAIARIEEMLT